MLNLVCQTATSKSCQFRDLDPIILVEHGIDLRDVTFAHFGTSKRVLRHSNREVLLVRVTESPMISRLTLGSSKFCYWQRLTSASKDFIPSSERHRSPASDYALRRPSSRPREHGPDLQLQPRCQTSH